MRIRKSASSCSTAGLELAVMPKVTVNLLAVDTLCTLETTRLVLQNQKLALSQLGAVLEGAVGVLAVSVQVILVAKIGSSCMHLLVEASDRLNVELVKRIINALAVSIQEDVLHLLGFLGRDADGLESVLHTIFADGSPGVRRSG